MKNKICTVITATGSFVPPKVVPNQSFLNAEFYDPNGTKIETANDEIIRKFFEITNIEERRYAESNQATSHLATFAALDAIESRVSIAKSLSLSLSPITLAISIPVLTVRILCHPFRAA
jgi:3-oxoacyl-[acyl-carrier-protein] synthase III